MRGLPPRRLDLLLDGGDEILVIDENHIVRRPVHALQEAITAVVEAIQHVGEIIVSLAPDGVFRRGRKQVVFKLLRQNQRRFALLQTEILRLAVEYLGVAVAFGDGGGRETPHDGPGPGVVRHSRFKVNLLDHADS